MGLTFHQTLVITGSEEALKDIRKNAIEVMSEYELQHLVSKLHGGLNGVYSFAIFTSGSQNGWGPDEDHKQGIDTVMDYIDELDIDIDYYFAEYGHDRSGISGDDEDGFELMRTSNGYESDYENTAPFDDEEEENYDY